MINRLQFREILAWLTLIIAIVLFSVTIGFAQTKSVTVNNNDGEVHVKMSRIENGKTTVIDTTFKVNDDSDVESIVDELSSTLDKGDGNVQHEQRHKKDNGNMKKKKIIIDIDAPEMTESNKQKLHDDLRRSMKDMHRGLVDLQKTLKSMHIHVDSDDDMDFDFDMPDMKDFDDDSSSAQAYSYRFSHRDDDLDSLKDDEHIIVVGDKDEKAPVLEKTITSKNGKQVFVYKRSISKKIKTSSSKDLNDDNKIDSNLKVSNLKYFPNPTTGKLNISFKSEEAGDMVIQILNENGKVVFTDKLNNFSGQYSKDIDLTDNSKGSYVLKISRGDNLLVRKIILN